MLVSENEEWLKEGKKEIYAFGVKSIESIFYEPHEILGL